MNSIPASSSLVSFFAKAGLTAKGIVYCLLGILAFMAAFHLNGQSVADTDKEGVLHFIEDQAGGRLMLGLIALGLICYCIWRGIQAFGDTEHEGKKPKGLAKRARYFLSGLVYASLAAIAVKMLFFQPANSGDDKQHLVQELLQQPFGQAMVIMTALVFFAIGCYQVYYGISEKYRKHASGSGSLPGGDLLLKAGKVGYIARGTVWLLIAWMFFKAGMHANSSEAGDTSKAFGFISGTTYGPFLLAAIGAGLCCYGIFNFIRARFERTGTA